jgi:hypothetical protein
MAIHGLRTTDNRTTVIKKDSRQWAVSSQSQTMGLRTTRERKAKRIAKLAINRQLSTISPE